MTKTKIDQVVNLQKFAGDFIAVFEAAGGSISLKELRRVRTQVFRALSATLKSNTPTKRERLERRIARDTAALKNCK